MKNTKNIVLGILILITIVGWFTIATGGKKGSEKIDTRAYITQADKWVEEGLYQRAILNYTKVINQDNAEGNWTKIIKAYDLRYNESNDILSDYIATLENAVKAYPKNVDFIQRLYELHMEVGSYEKAFNCLNTAVANGVKNQDILDELKELKYSYSARLEYYKDFRSISLDSYAVTNGELWGRVAANGDTILPVAYKYASPAGASGATVYSLEKDSRIISNSNFVYGIFSFDVTESGCYADDLVPVLKDGKYNYYDCFAKESFGGYKYAGSFQNGYAAVQTDKGWNIIDKTGKDVSGTFADILVDTNGNYMTGSVMVAAKEKNKYQFFDATGKAKNSFTAENMDICMGSDIVAFEKNGKWGFVNTDGKVVIDPQYDDAKSFAYGLAGVCKDGKWGFINTDNELAIKYDFIDVDYFNSTGSCFVKNYVENLEDAEKNYEWQMITLNLGIR